LIRKEALPPDGDVVAAGGVADERIRTHRSVTHAGVVYQRIITLDGVVVR
jgi:hypothetical protein